MSIEDASRCVEGSIELYIELYIEDVEARDSSFWRGYYEVFVRDVLGRSAPVDCRIVRRSNPIINLLFTPCTLKKRNILLLSKIRSAEGLSEHHPQN